MVHDVPSGSYVVEVISPAHKFEPVRVDITSKGKMRWAFPDLPLYRWVLCAWQHSAEIHRSSTVGLILPLRLDASASFNIPSRSTFLTFQSLMSFFLFMAWNKRRETLKVYLLICFYFLCSYPEIKFRHKLVNCFIIFQHFFFFFLHLPFSISLVKVLSGLGTTKFLNISVAPP